jgi:hypothetical protein
LLENPPGVDSIFMNAQVNRSFEKEQPVVNRSAEQGHSRGAGTPDGSGSCRIKYGN